MRHVGSDPQAERGRGEVNLSPIRVLTLRPRVGGFYVSGRLWEAQCVVFYVSGRVWEAQLVVFYVSGRLSQVVGGREAQTPWEAGATALGNAAAGWQPGFH